MQRARCEDSGDMRKETSFHLVLKIPDAHRLCDLAEEIRHLRDVGRKLNQASSNRCCQLCGGFSLTAMAGVKTFVSQQQ